MRRGSLFLGLMSLGALVTAGVIPAASPVPGSSQRLVLAGRLSATGTLTAAVSISTEGENQGFVGNVQLLDRDKRRALATLFAREQLQDPSVDVALQEDVPPVAGTSFQYRIAASQYASLTERSSARPLPRLFLMAVADVWSAQRLAAIPAGESVRMAGALTCIESTTIDFDDSWDAVAPKPVTLDRPFASYESAYTIEGHRLTATRRLEIKVREVTSALRPDLVAFAKAVGADLDAKVTWRRRDPAGSEAAIATLDVGQLCKEGREALGRGDYRGARDLALRAKTKAPDSAEVWSVLGRSEMGLGHVHEAETALKKVVEIGTVDERALMELGQFYVSQRRWDDGAAVFQQAVQKNPRNAKAQERLGECLGILGRNEESIAPFRAYVEAVPGDADGYFALGGAYLYSGHPEQGKDQLLKGLAHAKGPATRLKFASILAEEGLDTATAIRVAQETLDAVAAACRNVSLDRPPSGYAQQLGLAAISYRVLGMAAAVDGAAPAMDLLRTSFDIVPDGKTAQRIARVLARRGKPEEAFRYFAISVDGWGTSRLTFADIPEELRPWAKRKYPTAESLRAAADEAGRERLFLRRIRPTVGEFKMPKGKVRDSGVTLKARVLVGEDGAIENSRLEGGSEPYLAAARADLVRIRFQPVGPPASRFKTLRTIEFFYLPTPEVRAFWEFEFVPQNESEPED